VGVEVHEPQLAVLPRDGAHVRLGDRVVAAQDDGDRSGRDDLGDGALDLRVRRRGVRGHDRRIAEIDHAELREGVDLRLEVGPGRAARRSDGTRPEAGSRPVRDEFVGRRADDRDVEPGELGRILRVRHPCVGEEACVVGLVGETELAPALERVDHEATSRS
jgi:hypothetical protein